MGDAGRISCRYSADRLPAGKKDAAGQRMSLDGEIGPAARLAQIADGCRAAPTVARRELKIAGPLLRGSVEIVVAREARLPSGFDEGFAKRMRLADVGNGERASDPVQRVFAPLLILGTAEIGQDVVEAPAGIAKLPPMIEIRRLAAEIEQTIDRA
jgi:hypothetical protein